MKDDDGRRTPRSLTPRDRRLLSRLGVETASLFAPGLGHAKAIWQRVREGHEAPLRTEVETLRAQAASMAATNERMSVVVTRQNEMIDDLIVENERLRQALASRR